MDERELRSAVFEALRFDAARTLSTAPQSRFRTGESGDLVWSHDPARPASYYHRVFRLEAAHLSRLDELSAPYAVDGIEPWFELEPGALCTDVGRALTARGLAPILNLAYLQRRPERAEPTDVRVQGWSSDRADDFPDLLESTGVELTAEVRDARRSYYCTDRFRPFVAEVDRHACGSATSFVDGETAYLANAFT